jgi:hypothetical protein
VGLLSWHVSTGFSFPASGCGVVTKAKLRYAPQNNGPLQWASLLLGALVLSACGVEGRDPLQLSDSAGAAAPTPQAASLSVATSSSTTEPRSLEGWLSIVWNERPHFFLTDDDGQTVEILLDEQLTTPLGGPLALDRSRVIVLAVVSPETPSVFQAISIAPVGEG